VTWKLWTSMLKILTFRDLPFWYNCFEFSLLFHMNQNDITGWRVSFFLSPAVSQIAVSAVHYCLSVCAVDCFHVLWNETIIFYAWKWLYFINHILFMLLFCVCYFILLFLVFCDFLERNVRFTLHMFMVSDFFFRSYLVTNFGKPIFILG